MRISNPKLFNGQHLATREDITKWLSGGVVAEYGDLQIPVSGIVGLNEIINNIIDNTEHTHIAGNGINISSKNASGQITFSAVVKQNDLHLGLDASGIQTSGLVTASGSIISAGVTVATNLEALDAEIGKLSGGTYISGDVVASDLKRLDTQVKANFNAITGNTANVGDLEQLVSGAKTSLVDNINDFHEYVGTVPSSDMSVIQFIESKAQALEDLIGTVQGQALGIKDGAYIYFGTETVGEGENQKDLTVINGWDVAPSGLNSIVIENNNTDHSHVIGVTAKTSGAINVENGLSVNVDGKTVQIVDNQLSAVIDVPVTEITSPSGSIDVTHDGTTWNIDVRVKDGERYLHIDDTGNGTETVNLDVTADGTYVKIANTVAANLTALDNAIASSDKFGEHTIVLDKLDQATDGYASSYQLLVDGVQRGDIINIPKDQFLKGADIVEGTYAGGVFTESAEGNKYIHFTFEIKVKDPVTLAETTTEKHIYLDVQELCDVYTAGSGLVLNGTEFNVNLGTNDETAKYLGFDNTSALVIDGLDVDTDGHYIKTTNYVSGNLVELDDAVYELSGKFGAIDHKTLTIGNTTYDTESDAVVTTADLVVLGALTGVVSGNAGIAVSEKADGKVSVSAVVKEGDKHLGIGTNGIETSGLVTASGYVISADVTVAENLEALDTQVKTNSANISEITLVEVEFNVNASGDYTLGFAGKVLQVFDTEGVCYPEIKYANSIATISIGADATDANKAATYTAIVSKKQVPAE